eukprot:SAG22_NODE_9502_length_586_cov_1.166324_1_plen_66_part_01
MAAAHLASAVVAVLTLACPLSLFLIVPEDSPLYRYLGITGVVMERVQSTSSCLAVSNATLLTISML